MRLMLWKWWVRDWGNEQWGISNPKSGDVLRKTEVGGRTSHPSNPSSISPKLLQNQAMFWE
jgi:hypothetical protein